MKFSLALLHAARVGFRGGRSRPGIKPNAASWRRAVNTIAVVCTGKHQKDADQDQENTRPHLSDASSYIERHAGAS